MNEIKHFSKKSTWRIVKPVLGLVILAIVLAGVLRFTPLGDKLPLPQFIKNMVVKQDDAAKQAKETKELLVKVGKHMVLPTEEDPVVAVINDRELLVKDQQFYQDAENGDYLIIYPKMAKAIIYSKKRDLLVNVGPLIVNPTAQSEPPAINANTYTEKKQLTIEVRNGTGKNGLANDMKKTLEQNVLFQVTKTADAANKEYEKTVIVDVGKTQNKEAIRELAKVLGAQVTADTPSPEGETSADVLVILGRDQAEN